jgi:carbamoyl-phosphate synthase large subunit
MKVLFVGSGPYRISQETRGNLFAHSCLAYLAEKGIPYVVMDNDAAAPLFDYARPAGYISCPFDAQAVSDVIASERPSHVWPVCAGKEVQAILARILDRPRGSPALAGGVRAYRAAADWASFRETAASAGVSVPFGGIATSIEEAAAVAGRVGFPVFLSASEPRGGGGARIAYNYEELAAHAGRLLSWSLGGKVLVVRVHERHPQCEAHVLADASGKMKVLGIVDALAPLGVHIGNAATVFPARSLSKSCETAVGKAASALAGAVGLAGYGVFHFGLEDGRTPYAVGMRVGFTSSSYIVAVGLNLDLGRAATALAFGQSIREAARFTPATRRIAVSVPHFDNDLFPGSSDILGPHKVSTGMGTGVAGNFAAAFLAADRSARDSQAGAIAAALTDAGTRDVLSSLAAPRTGFLADVVATIARGHSFEEIDAASGLAREYTEELARLVRVYQGLRRAAKADAAAFGRAAATARKAGFTESEIAAAAGKSWSPKPLAPARAPKRRGRTAAGVFVVCGPPARAVGIVDESDVLLGGLSRSMARKGRRIALVGWRSRQPLDLLFLADSVHWGEPADTLRKILAARPVAGVYIDPRNADWEALSRDVLAAGVPLASADPALVSSLNDRKVLSGVLPRVGLLHKEGEEAATPESVRRAAAAVGYPVLVRQKGTAHSFVVAYDGEQLDAFLKEVSGAVVVERFLEDLVEAAVVVLADGKDARAVAVIEILEEPGISSIDRAGVLPPFSISERSRGILAARGEALVAALAGKGLVTLRLGLRYDIPYFLSATVGASREVPFASAALRRDIVAAAADVFAGATLSQAWPEQAPAEGPVFVRHPVFSFGRFPGADTVLGTRPRSTGDVMGVGTSFALAYAAARRATGRSLPAGGTVFVSLRDRDKRAGMAIGRQLTDLGFRVVATEGTARALSSAGVEARVVHRVSEGRPNVVDLLKNGEITMVIYTPSGRAPREDEVQIRTVAWGLGIPVITTAGEALAALNAIEAMRRR